MVYCKTRVGVVLLVVFPTCFVEMDLLSYILVAFHTCGYTYRYITWACEICKTGWLQRATENVNAAYSKANMLHGLEILPYTLHSFDQNILLVDSV